MFFYEDFWTYRAPTMEAAPPSGDWDRSGNVTAYIHDIDIYGLMEIRFNATMFTDFNISELDIGLLDIYLEPSYELPDGFNMSSINFTWNATIYNNTNLTDQWGQPYAVMYIQIDWNDELAISPEVI